MLDHITPAEGIAYLSLAMITVWATISDLKTRKIPNILTVTALGCGLAWQAIFHGWPGLADAAAGFAIGFGTFFVLWLTGGGGGGDAKLMAALGAWLGFRPTLYVLFISTVLVLVITIFQRITGRKKAGPAAESKKRNRGKSAADEPAPAPGVALALPVTMAVWCLLIADRLITVRDLIPM